MNIFSRSLQIGSFRGVAVRLHISMLLIAPAAFYLFRPEDRLDWLFALISMIGLLVCIFLHEMSHTIAAQHFGITVKHIVLWPLGGSAHLNRIPKKPHQRFIIDAAGPMMSFFLALVLGILWFTSQLQFPLWDSFNYFWLTLIYRTLFSLAIMNGALVVLNLLPIYPLDGGGMLNALMEMLFGKRTADIISIVVGIPFLLGLIALGIRTRDFVLLILCTLLALSIGTLDPRSRHWITMGINYLFRRTGFHHLNQDYDQARRGHTAALEKNPGEISHLLGRAVAYINLSEHDLALADIDTILQKDPQHVAALETKGELHGLKKEYELALEYFNRVKALKPDWSFPYFDSGGIYLDMKEYERAISEFNQAIELESQHPLFFVVRSMAHFRMQNLGLAHWDQTEAMRLSPQHALTMIDVNLNVYEGYLDWALDYYGWVLAKYPRQWMAYQGRADAYAINGQPESGIADYDQALKLAPTEAILYLRRGLAHMKMENTGQAGDDFRQVLNLARKTHLQRRAEQLLAESIAPKPIA